MLTRTSKLLDVYDMADARKQLDFIYSEDPLMKYLNRLSFFLIRYERPSPIARASINSSGL